MPFPVFAAGDILLASDMNAVGLWLVKTQTIGTSVTSINVTSAFSSSYANYLVTVSGGTVAANAALNLQLGATVTNYQTNYIYTSYNNTVAGIGTTAGTSYDRFGFAATGGLYAFCYISAPQLASNTYFNSFYTGASDLGWAGGRLVNTTQYTDFTMSCTQALTGGVIRVYGMRN